MVHLKLATPVFFEMSEGPVFISVEGGAYFEFIMSNNLWKVYSTFVTCGKTSSGV